MVYSKSEVLLKFTNSFDLEFLSKSIIYYLELEFSLDHEN